MNLVIDLERRHNPRRRCTERQAISYRCGWMSMRRQGWLYDLSEDGASFFADRGSAPRADQELELLRESDGLKVHCRVVRVQPIDSTRVLVGCRLTDAAPGRPMMQLAEAA
jgi:hypothetical protein